MVSKKCPMVNGPARFPTANAIRYSGADLRGHPVELAEHQGVGEEDRVVQERLADHERGAQHRPARIVAEKHSGQRQVADLFGGLQFDRLALVDRGQRGTGGLHLVLDVGDRALGGLHAAVHDLPARALRQVPPHQQDHQAQHRADQEGESPAQAQVDRLEEDERAERAENRTGPVRAVDRDVDSAPESGRDQLVDRRIDGGVFPADAHTGDKPGDVKEDDPARAIAQCERGETAAHEIHTQGDHEEVASAELVRQAPEEQCADHLASQVHGGDEPDRRRRQTERLGLRQRVGHRASHGDLETIQDPGHTQRNHHPRMKRRPRQPIDPGGNEAADHALRLSWCRHDRLLAHRHNPPSRHRANTNLSTHAKGILLKHRERGGR